MSDDSSGNAISGLASSAFSFGLAGGTSAGTFGTVTETATKGTYTTTFTGTAAGTTSNLTVTINGISLATKPNIEVAAPVTITGAYVSSTAWASAFNSYLASKGLGSTTFGFALQTGANQLTTLPWTNLNQISVVFSGPVGDVGLASLKLVGGSGGTTPNVTGFTSDGSNTYTWTLSGPLTNNRYVFAIATTGSSFGTPGSTQVVDADGAGISGTFATGQAFPSGNGLAGSTFDFFFNVLPGDVDRNSDDNATDINDVRPLSTGTRTTSNNYIPYYDLLGAGIINATTLNTLRPLTGRLESAIRQPPSDTQGVGTTGFVGLELGVQETGSTSPLAASGSLIGSPTGTASNLASPSPTSSSTTSVAATSVSATGSEGTPISTTINRDHGHHRLGATDEAVSNFDLVDLWA